jgi:hypothetical protein
MREAKDQPDKSAADNLGRHLLGRNPQPRDRRDHRMLTKLRAEPVGDAQLDLTLRDLLAGGFLANWRDILAFWRWIKKRKPPPVDRVRLWEDQLQLDQGATPHCVGFAWTQWGNTEPIQDTFQNSDGHAVYYECKVIDGEPGAEDGSITRSGAKAMQNRGRLGEYVFAATVTEIVAWILTHGPVVVGTDWHDEMFSPENHSGFLVVEGDLAGGHEWLLIGYSDNNGDPYFVMQNSWGLGWSEQGRAKIRLTEFTKLLRADGDAAAGAELP